MYASHKIEGATVRVQFRYAAGLKAKAGDAVTGFVLAGADKVFHPATAVVTEDGLVEITSKAVAKPAALRYGWADNPVVNLVNQHNLPPHHSARMIGKLMKPFFAILLFAAGLLQAGIEHSLAFGGGYQSASGMLR